MTLLPILYFIEIEKETFFELIESRLEILTSCYSK